MLKYCHTDQNILVQPLQWLWTTTIQQRSQIYLIDKTCENNGEHNKKCHNDLNGNLTDKNQLEGAQRALTSSTKNE